MDCHWFGRRSYLPYIGPTYCAKTVGGATPPPTRLISRLSYSAVFLALPSPLPQNRDRIPRKPQFQIPPPIPAHPPRVADRQFPIPRTRDPLAANIKRTSPIRIQPRIVHIRITIPPTPRMPHPPHVARPTPVVEINIRAHFIILPTRIPQNRVRHPLRRPTLRLPRHHLPQALSLPVRPIRNLKHPANIRRVMRQIPPRLRIPVMIEVFEIRERKRLLRRHIRKFPLLLPTHRRN